MKVQASFRWSALALLVMAFARHVGGHPLDNWQSRLTIPGPTGFHSVIWAEDRFVAVGGSRSAFSTNGSDWIVQDTGIAGSLFEIAHGNGQFAAVGLNGLIVSSTVGSNWVQQVPATNSYHLNGIACGAGQFVAVGDGGRILVSSNGADWSQAISGTSYGLRNIVYGNGAFVVALTPGTNLLSMEGTNWMKVPSGISLGLYTIGFGGGQFMAVDINRAVWLSQNGTNWSAFGRITGIRPPCVGWGNGQFLVAANPAIEHGQGGYWIPIATNIMANGIAFGNNTFVVTTGLNIYQSVPIAHLRLFAAGEMEITGPPGTYTIEAITNPSLPVLWQPLTNIVVTNSPAHWVDSGADAAGTRLYRAIFLP